MNDIANIELFDSETIQTDDSTDRSTLDSDISILFGESFYTGKSHRDVFTQLVSNLVLSAELDKLTPLMSPNEPNTVQIIGNREHISNKGTKLTKPIELTKYHMYVNFSKVGLYNQIQKLAELTGKKVIFERW